MPRGSIGGSVVSQAVLDALASAQSLASAAMTKANTATNAAGSAAQAAATASQAASSAAQTATTAAQTAGTASQTATSAAQVATDLKAAVTAADKAHADILAAGVEQVETATATVPAMVLLLGTASVDVTLTWDTPFSADAYILGKPKLLTTTATLLGKVTAVVKSQSKTGCVITVTTSAAVAAGSSTLLILGYRKGVS